MSPWWSLIAASHATWLAVAAGPSALLASKSSSKDVRRAHHDIHIRNQTGVGRDADRERIVVAQGGEGNPNAIDERHLT